MPIYAIRNKTCFLRLVEARTEAQAIRHCARGEFSASIPTLAEAIEFGRNGGVVEDAGAEITGIPIEIQVLPAVAKEECEAGEKT